MHHHEPRTNQHARQIPPAHRMLQPAQTLQHQTENLVIDETTKHHHRKVDARTQTQYAGFRADGPQLYDRYRALGVSVPETEPAASSSN